MGWEAIHLFQFTVRDVVYAGTCLHGQPMNVPVSQKREVSLRLRHWVLVGARAEGRGSRVRRVGQAASGVHWRLGRCPPEDCGGPDGYHAQREEAMKGRVRLSAEVPFKDLAHLFWVENSSSGFH